MIASPLRAIPILVVLLATAAWTQASALAAGGDTPPVLTDKDMPPVADDEDAAESPAAAKPAAPDAFAPPTAATVPPLDKGIVVDALGTTEGSPVGTLDPANGGLGDGIWGGSSRQTVEDLLVRSPLVYADTALRSLARKVVLTKASAPPGASKRAFVTVRIEKLLDGGLIEEAGALAAQASLPNDPDFARVQADAVLVANRAADVCGGLTATRLTAGEPFWLELRAYCAAAAGDEATAELTRAVLEAQGSPDKAYDTLLDDALNHKTMPPGPIAHPTALHVFLLQQAGLPIPGDVAAVMGTSENFLAMRDVRNSMPVRIEAAERIVRTGAVSVAELKTLADAHDIPANRLTGALADAPNLPFFSGQILLRRAAQLETRPDAREQLVITALFLGGKAGLLPLAAGLQADIAATVKPAPLNHAKATVFARALLLAGLPDASARWLPGDAVWQTIVDLAAPTPERDAKAQVAFSAFVAVPANTPPLPDPDRSAKALLLGLADALGRPMPPAAKAQAPSIGAQFWDGKRPDAQTMLRIEDAASKPERKGEALLLILDTARSIGWRDLAPDVTIKFVRLLRAMGLPNAAHDVAIEALAQYVPPPLPPPPHPAQ